MYSRDRYHELRAQRPDWFANTPGMIEILFSDAEMDGAEQAAWARLRRRMDKDPTIAHATIDWVSVGVDESEYSIRLRDAVRFPNGRLGVYERVMSRPEVGPGAAVLAFRGDQIVLVTQYRHALRRSMLEAPRGFSSSGESVVNTARRELAEEIHATAADCQQFGNVAPDSGFLGHVVGLVSASIPHAGGANPEEIQDVIEVSVDQFHQMIASGEIFDGFTLALYASAIANGLIPPPR